MSKPRANLLRSNTIKSLYSVSKSTFTFDKIFLSFNDIDFIKHSSTPSNINSNIKYGGSSFSFNLFSLSSSCFFCFSSSSCFSLFNFFIFSSSFFFSSSSFIFFAFSLFSFSSFSSSSLFCFSSSISNGVLFSNSNDNILFVFCIFSNNSMKNMACVSLKINLHFSMSSFIFIFSKFLFLASNICSKSKRTVISSTKFNPFAVARLLKSPSKSSNVAMQKCVIFIEYTSNN